jgi:hypothetical protein
MNENETQKKLTPAQRLAIEKLLTSGSVEDAAISAKVARSSLYRWMKDDLFVAELRAAEAEAITGLSRSLAGLGNMAASALRAALEDPKMSIRLRASEIVIGNLLKLRELVDLETRLAQLEEKTNGKPEKKT